MKATVFSKAVVMMAVVMASVMNFSASATTPADYVKNEEMTGELMTAKTIFRNEDGHLSVTSATLTLMTVRTV